MAHVQAAIAAFQGFILSAGTFGVGVFAFFERVLIPTGLHHFIYTPFYYDNAAVNGGIFAASGQHPAPTGCRSEHCS